MPFGKHRDKPLDEVPTSYLRWVLRECVNIELWLRMAVVAELALRCGEEPPPRSGPGAGAGRYPPPIDVRAVVVNWYRQMSLRWHPDRGGSDEAMQAVNYGFELLKKLAGVP
jgi:hypothetical protein